MRTALDRKTSWHRWFLNVPTLVALAVLAAVAVLAPAASATFYLFAALAGVLICAGLAAVLAMRKRATAATPGPWLSQSPTPAGQAVEDRPSFIVLPAHARADEMSRVLFAPQSYFPVMQGREVVGVVFKGRLLKAIAQGQGDHLIAELMDHSSRAQSVLAS